jgi:hypothetical protein
VADLAAGRRAVMALASAALPRPGAATVALRGGQAACLVAALRHAHAVLLR